MRNRAREKDRMSDDTHDSRVLRSKDYKESLKNYLAYEKYMLHIHTYVILHIINILYMNR